MNNMFNFGTNVVGNKFSDQVSGSIPNDGSLVPEKK